MNLYALSEDLVGLLEYKDTEVVRRIKVGKNTIGLNKKEQAVSGNPQAMHLWNTRRAQQREVQRVAQTPQGKAAAAEAAAKANKVDWKDKFKAIAKNAGHQLVHPFVAAKDLLVDPAKRKKFGKYLKGVVRKETKETKHLRDTIGKALSGERIYEADRNKAINQAIDLVKVAMVGATVGHLFKGGIIKAIGALTSPVDEVVGMAIDKPLRDITERAFGVAHGLLPSAFYEEANAVDNVLDGIIDYILDEIAKSDFDEPV